MPEISLRYDFDEDNSDTLFRHLIVPKYDSTGWVGGWVGGPHCFCGEKETMSHTYIIVE